MSRDVNADLAGNLRFTLELADRILLSAGKDPNDAILKAAGTLAQVIYITTQDEVREQTITSSVDMLRTYLKLLDEVTAIGSLGIRDPD